MSFTEIFEISERLKRTSHRVKNSGDIDLAELGLRIARKVKKQSTLIHAKTIEDEYLSVLKEKYSPISPIDKIPPTITSMDGYVDPASDDSGAPADTQKPDSNETDVNTTSDDTSQKQGTDKTDVENADKTTDVPDKQNPDPTADNVTNSEKPDANSIVIETKPGEDETDIKNENNKTEATADTSFDVNSAIDTLNNNAEPTYTQNCATYVREALEQGGIDSSGHPGLAKDYGPFLEQKGFNSVDNSEIDDPQKGDIVVIQAKDGHPAGHIAMFNGDKWVSDTEQRDYSAGNYSEFKLYRHK